MLLSSIVITCTANVLNFWILVGYKKNDKTNSADPDQTASSEAVWSGPSLFAILSSFLWIPALITNILIKNWKRNLCKLFEILEYLP